jgi:hypothetical protein
MRDEADLGRQQVVKSAWHDQAIWSETANRLKAELSKWRKWAAVAGVSGALFETLAGTLTGLDNKWWWLRSLIALAGTVILAVVPYVVRTKASAGRVRDWVRARSVSEALKETIYRYRVEVTPFGSGSGPADLIQEVQAVKDKARDLSAIAACSEPPAKEHPLSLTIDEYVEDRVKGQIERHYRPKGQQNAIAARKLHNLEFFLGLLAVVMGALVSAATPTGLKELSLLGSWVAVVTTAGAAVTAHLAASRYDHQAMTYFGTADRLTGLRDEWLVDPNRLDPTRVAKFVDDCEHAISTENEAWLAEWSRARTGE